MKFVSWLDGRIKNLNFMILEINLLNLGVSYMRTEIDHIQFCCELNLMSLVWTFVTEPAHIMDLYQQIQFVLVQWMVLVMHALEVNFGLKNNF